MNTQILKKKNSILLFLYFVLILSFDQISKYFILENFEIYQSVEINSFLNIILVFNTGAAFSIFADGHDWQRYMLITSSVIIILFLIIFLIKYCKNNWLQKLSVYFILAGAVGNLVDRIRLGMVVDFIDFHIGGLHWPAFNIADSAISIGAISLIVLELKYSSNKEKGSKES